VNERRVRPFLRSCCKSGVQFRPAVVVLLPRDGRRLPP
jgi:hypothetical protein